MVVKRLAKSTHYPLPHHENVQWSFNLSTSAQYATTAPICHYDEGRGSPSAIQANPEHASFAEYAGSNCFPESYISSNGFHCNLRVKMEKHALETDKLHNIRFGVLVSAVSFLTDLTAKDEKSGLEIEDILHLQHDTTNRETYPLYTGTDMAEPYANAGSMGADQAGLTTDTSIEEVDFTINNYYDILQYGAVAPKLKRCQSGIKWMNISRQHPVKNIRIHLKNKVKKMHEYAGLFVTTLVYPTDNPEQTVLSGDVTSGNHLTFQLQYRFNEWNEQFDMERV
jgi:hypothetical protein